MEKLTLQEASRKAMSHGLEFLARQLVEGFVTGLHKSPYHGFSVEFAEHRLYNNGQATKNIDWKVFARTDKLFTRQYEEETNLRCMLLLDCSPSMFYPNLEENKFRFSILASASLAWLLYKQRDATGLCLFDDQIKSITPVKSTRAGMEQIFSALQKIQENPGKVDGQYKQSSPHRSTTSVPSVLHEIAEKIHKRALIILFSDLLSNEEPEETFKALQHLKHNKHEVIIFHVYDRSTEKDFEFADRPHEFIDIETGEKILLRPSDVRTSYLSSVGEFNHQLKQRCHQLKIDLVEADINAGFEPILEAYLIKRRKLA